MPEINISTFEYGFSASGVQDYLEQIKTVALTNAKDAVNSKSALDPIRTACEAHWEGKSRENFLTNLSKDADHVANQFDQLYNILESEINSVAAAMANKDEELIK